MACQLGTQFKKYCKLFLDGHQVPTRLEYDWRRECIEFWSGVFSFIDPEKLKNPPQDSPVEPRTCAIM